MDSAYLIAYWTVQAWRSVRASWVGPMRILLVDDDEALMESLADKLIHQRYAVDIATNGGSAQDYLDLFNYDLVVLDLMLPDGDGIEFCQQFRGAGYTNPLMILTAKESTAEKVRALDAGGDDYVVKPFDFDELCARIRALLRRDSQGLPPVLQWGVLTLDPSTYETAFDQQPVRLTPKEFSMLELFLRHPHRVYSLGSIIDDLWSFEDPPGEDAIRTHIKGLRRKLQGAGAPKDLIKTVYGLGYRLNEKFASPSPVAGKNAAPKLGSSTDVGKPSPTTSPAISSETPSETSSKSASGISPGKKKGKNEVVRGLALEAAALQVSSAVSESGVLTGAEMGERTSLPDKLAQACHRYLEKASEQIKLLDQAVAILRCDDLESTGRGPARTTARTEESAIALSQAQMIAHRLAGSLGSFGLPEGSRIARQLETQLRTVITRFAADSSAEKKSSDGSSAEKTAVDTSSADSLLADGPLVDSRSLELLLEQLRQQVDDAIASEAQLADSQYADNKHAETKHPDLSSEWDAMPVVLLVSDDDALVQSLSEVAITFSVALQTASTPVQAAQRFSVPLADQASPTGEPLTTDEPLTTLTHRRRPDLLLIDVDSIEASGDESTSLTALVDQAKQRPSCFVMVLEPASSLERRLALAKRGVDLVGDRTASPLHTITAAMGLLQSKASYHGRPLQVAIADDDPQMLTLLKRVLAPWGFVVRTFESGLELWHWLNDADAKADILLLDVEMPEMSGIELCQVLRADTRFQRLPILFLTAHREDSVRSQAFQYGADDFIDKSVVPGELVVRLRNQVTRACRFSTPGWAGSSQGPSQT
ncbi:MAG: response regulator [Cyanobacteria bacterium P01_F01_bin.53]